MRISYNWLRRYIDLKTRPEDLAKTLTGLGLEVEEIEFLGKKFDGFLVGEVLEVQKHPKADRLSVCRVRISPAGIPLQIVCGAPNVAAGQKVVVGTAGSTVPHNQHDPGGKPFVLTNAIIRGVESQGMICSEKELGIGDDGNGIKVLHESAVVGTALSEFLGLNDVAFELGITPNRPDCLSHIGVARDIAAAYGLTLNIPAAELTELPTVSTKDHISIRIENGKDCPRYTARMIRNVTVGESPEWLKKLLSAAGLRPINNIVDATNFVMMEFGQPLHAFDYDNVAQKTIIVKSAKAGEAFTTLDGKKHSLSADDLMICDGDKSVAIGGVMGGLNSEISSGTKTVLLESAYFSPASVRKTSKKLGIHSDASYRFERGVDPNIADIASARAAALIAECSGGEVLNGCIDVYPEKILPKAIVVRFPRVNAILGTALTDTQIISLLNAVGMKTEKHSDSNEILCTIPTFRPDIEQEIDLIEEVARLYGYDNIENKISSEVVFTKPDAIEQKISRIRTWCESVGLNEVMTNSLVDEQTAALFSTSVIKVRNPLSEDLAVLRPSLMATMLQSISFNFNHGAQRQRIFEIGTVFSMKSENKQGQYLPNYVEDNILGFCFSGTAHNGSWYDKVRKVDIFDLKGVVFSLLEAVGLDNRDLIYYNASSSLTEMSIGVEINGTYVGFIGQCSSQVLKNYKIEHDVFYAELHLDTLVQFKSEKKYQPFSRFPTVVRDVAFIVNKDIPVADIEKKIVQSGGNVVSSVTLFDIFSGASLGEGMKSVAFSIRINSMEKTLTDKEIDTVVSHIVQEVTQLFNATLRSL